MKSSLHPAVVAVIIAVVVAVSVLIIWHNSQGVNTGPGRLQSDLNMDAAGKQAEQNPDQFQKAVQESLKRDQSRKGGH